MKAFVFPGQGTQRVGMGRQLAERFGAAETVFRESASILDRDVSSLCFDGPRDRLTETDNAQVAIFVVSLATLRVLSEHGLAPDAVAGHSVGEIAALQAAGVLTYEDGLRLVAARGRLMATVGSAGAMVSVTGLPDATVHSLCSTARRVGPVVVALDNGPDMPVVSGSVAAVARFADLAKGAGARRVAHLTVGGAYHSPLMAEVSDRWAALVERVPMVPPRVPIALNATGRLETDVIEIKRALTDQLTSPVRWTDCVRSLVAIGVTALVEVGASRTLCGLVRRIDPTLATSSTDDIRSVTRLLAERLTA